MAAKKADAATPPADPNNDLTRPNETAPKTHADPWATVVPVGALESLDRLKVLLYGPNGCGKTTCAARFERPLIGLTELQAVPAIKEANPRAIIKIIRNAQEILEFRQLCRSERLIKECDAVILDSLTDTQRIFKDLYTQAQKGRRDVTDVETWGKIIDATARLARELRDLPVHTAVICLDAEIEVEGEGLVHRPAVSGKALPNMLGQYFNMVGYVSRRTDTAGNVRREVMFTGPERYQCKGVSGIADVEAPEPTLWISKRFGTPMSTSEDKNKQTPAQRIALWNASGQTTSTEGAKPATNNDTTTNIQTTAAVDPFANT